MKAVLSQGWEVPSTHVFKQVLWRDGIGPGRGIPCMRKTTKVSEHSLLQNSALGRGGHRLG